MDQNTRSEFLSPIQLAEYLGVPIGTIYSWRHVGTGPPGARMGGHVRYRRSDVDEWVEAQKHRPAS